MSPPERRRPRALRDVDESRMTLVEHLVELRERLVKALLALGVGMVIAFVLFPQVFDVVQRPYCNLPPRFRPTPGDCRLYFFGVMDAFMVRMQVSLIVGALLSAPVWLYQLFAFITPGLHKRERRWVFPFVAVSFLLFAIGAFFAYVTIDRGLVFLLGFGGEEVVPLLDVRRYLSFFTLVLIAFGVSFEFPLVLSFLVLVGIVDVAKLNAWRRFMYFGLAVFTAVVTPSADPFTFIAMLVPLAIFYELVVVFAYLHRRAKRRRGDDGTERWADDETSPLDPAAPLDDTVEA